MRAAKKLPDASCENSWPVKHNTKALSETNRSASLQPQTDSRTTVLIERRSRTGEGPTSH